MTEDHDSHKRKKHSQHNESVERSKKHKSHVRLLPATAVTGESSNKIFQLERVYLRLFEKFNLFVHQF